MSAAVSTRLCRGCGQEVREGRRSCGACRIDTGDGLLDLSESLPGWVDGPKFVAWLEEHGLESKLSLGEGLARRMRDWQSGGVASVDAVDRVLVAMGFHLSELPDDFWVPHPRSAEAKAAA